MTDRDLYGLAVDFLADLHTRSLAETTTVVPTYNDDGLLVEAFQFTHWYLPSVGADVTEGLEAEYLDILRRIIDIARAGFLNILYCAISTSTT